MLLADVKGFDIDCVLSCPIDSYCFALSAATLKWFHCRVLASLHTAVSAQFCSCLLQNCWRTQMLRMLSYSLIDLIRHDCCTTQTFRRRGTGRKLSARHGHSAFHGRGHMAESMVWPCGPWHLIPQSTCRTTGVNWDVTGAVTAVLKPLGIIGIIGVMG